MLIMCDLYLCCSSHFTKNHRLNCIHVWNLSLLPSHTILSVYFIHVLHCFIIGGSAFFQFFSIYFLETKDEKRIWMEITSESITLTVDSQFSKSSQLFLIFSQYWEPWMRHHSVCHILNNHQKNWCQTLFILSLL